MKITVYLVLKKMMCVREFKKETDIKETNTFFLHVVQAKEINRGSVLLGSQLGSN